MDNGRLEAPDLDDRTWQQLVDQARDLIPVYAPEWTDHNPSDLGMALLELFAWLVESMSYRLNRVSDKHFIEFLNLIGITRDPATPATTMLTFSVAPGPATTTVPAGFQAATVQTEDNTVVVFETDAELTALPINLTHALLITKGLYNKYIDYSTSLVTAPVSGTELELTAGQSVLLPLGFDADTAEPVRLLVELSQALQPGDADVSWVFSAGALEPSSWITVPVVDDDTDGLQRDGYVELTVPGFWGAQNPTNWTSVSPDFAADEVDADLFWIGLRVANLTMSGLTLGIRSILFNAAKATNALTIAGEELLGVSDGTAFQHFALANAPLFKETDGRPHYHHLSIEVREPVTAGGVVLDAWSEWQMRTDLPEGDDPSFRLNPVLGEVMLGNYEATLSPEGHGRIPPKGSEIRAASYRYVGAGTEGNLAPETITVPRTALPGVIAVSNRVAASGGSAQETVEDTKRRGPVVLRNRYRAVNAEDYEYLAKEATTDVVKSRCLLPRLYTAYDTIPPGLGVGEPWTYGGLVREVGNVHVIVVPFAEDTVPTPEPTDEQLDEVIAYLQERRVLTNVLHVTGPRYLPIVADVSVRIWSQALDTGAVSSLADYQTALDETITRYFHPLYGGRSGQGWEIGEDVFVSALFDAIQPDSEIGFVESITVQADPPLYDPPDRMYSSATGVWVQLHDYELVCSGSHLLSVTSI